MDERQLRAQDAKQVIDSPVFKDSFNKVADYLESLALGCNPDNMERAQRIILSKQILAHIKRELIKLIEDGNVADLQIKALEEKKGMFNRLRR